MNTHPNKLAAPGKEPQAIAEEIGSLVTVVANPIDNQIGSCSNTTLLGLICICGPICAKNPFSKSTVSGAIPTEMNTAGKTKE